MPGRSAPGKGSWGAAMWGASIGPNTFAEDDDPGPARLGSSRIRSCNGSRLGRKVIRGQETLLVDLTSQIHLRRRDVSYADASYNYALNSLDAASLFNSQRAESVK